MEECNAESAVTVPLPFSRRLPPLETGDTGDTGDALRNRLK